MKTINEIRRENLRLAIGLYFKNSRQLALAIGVSPNSISRVFSSNPTSRRNVGDEMARSIEKEAGLPEGWMDADHGGMDNAIGEADPSYYSLELAEYMERVTDEGLEAVIAHISKSVPPKDAMKLALILLSRVESSL